MSSLAGFWDELKRRRVVRAVLSWAAFVFCVLPLPGGIRSTARKTAGAMPATTAAIDPIAIGRRV